MMFLKKLSIRLLNLDRYDKEIESLRTFPFGYRGVIFEYGGYEIRLKPYDTYNVFFCC